ncbi:MAG: 4Fe-4S dicluster domain-containing protein [Desulfobacterales bacterium]|nr:4Fe-4S dicluster domain-containing protein [Desulfobacterales bacterium]MCP4162636.1 4Fe-4S dicluster domain-containing protein [Deltaproteobacteria bacterium]
MALFINEKCNGCTLCAKICPSQAITGDKKELHIIDDNHCIECFVCGKLCPQDAVENLFGIVIKQEKKSSWKKPVFDNKKCMSCIICIETCPTGALFSSEQNEGDNAFPELIPKKCISCGFCESECPVEAVSLK